MTYTVDTRETPKTAMLGGLGDTALTVAPMVRRRATVASIAVAAAVLAGCAAGSGFAGGKIETVPPGEERIVFTAPVFAGTTPQRGKFADYWAGMSYFDVPVRQDFLQQTDNPVLAALMAPRGISLSTSADQLVAPIEGVYSVPRHYLEGSSGAVNPEYVAAAQPLWQFQEAVSDIARLYVISGDPAYAQLLVEFLDGWAGAGSLTEAGNKQGWYSITWATVDAGLTYSVVRNDPSLDPAAKGRVEAWLHEVAANNIAQPGALDYPNSDGRNNISYWRGLEATVVGKVTEDPQMFDWGIDTFKRALTDMNADGSFPGEMDRGEGALGYQHFAIEPLVLIAEVAARQGYDLYSLEVGGRSLHTAAAFSVAAIKDRSLIRRYTREPQRFTSKRGLSWAEVYYRRFPRPELAEFIGKGTLPSGAMRIAPLLTLYFGA